MESIDHAVNAETASINNAEQGDDTLIQSGEASLLPTAALSPVAITQKLLELIFEREKLLETISDILGSSKTGLYGLASSGFDLCENAGNAAIISREPRQRLQEIEIEIKDFLRAAHDARLDSLPGHSLPDLYHRYSINQT